VSPRGLLGPLRSNSRLLSPLFIFPAAQLSLALVAKSGGDTLVWLAGGLSAGVLISLGRHARLPVVAGTMIASIIAHQMAHRNILVTLPFPYATRAKPCSSHG
jgi:hypothetical protein